jgi:hypothetical protein
MTEQELYQQQQAQTQARPREQTATQTAEAQVAAEAGVKGTGRVCKYCQSEIPEGMRFCTHCGEEFEGAEIRCEVCQTDTTKAVCPTCGRRLKPYTCPKCKTQTTEEVCVCGEPLSPHSKKLVASAVTEAAAVQITEMSEAEAAAIERSFAQQETSEEFQEFIEKLIQRDIMKRERKYDQEMEARILRVNGPNPFSITLPDPEEQAKRFKAYELIGKSITEKRKKIIEDEIRALYPDPPPPPDNSAALKAEEERLAAELAAERAQMERKFAALLAKTESDISAFHEEEERKRLEEERRRIEEERRIEAARLAKIEAERQAALKAKQEAEERARKAALEAERIRLEQERERVRKQKEAEAYANRYLGDYHTNFDNGQEDLSIRNRTQAETVGELYNYTHYVQKCTVKENGGDIKIQQYAIFPLQRTSNIQQRFEGTIIGADGNIIEGDWYKRNGEHTGFFRYYRKH